MRSKLDSSHFKCTCTLSYQYHSHTHTHTHTYVHSLQAKLILQNSDEYSASSTPNLSRLEATLNQEDDLPGTEGAGRATLSVEYDAESIRSVSSTDYSVDPELKQREAVKEQLLLQDVGEDMSIQISTFEGETVDDSYYVIETNPEASFPVGLDTHGTQHLDVDALASKLASIEVARKNEEEGSPSRDSPDDPLIGFGNPLCSVSRNPQPTASGATGKNCNVHVHVQCKSPYCSIPLAIHCLLLHE